MKSIFVFQKNGKFLEELKQEDNFLSTIAVKDTKNKQFFITKEITQKTETTIERTMYLEEQTPKDKDFVWAVAATLRNEEFLTFVFDEEKREVARLLVVAPLTDKERLEFFTNLLAVPDSEITELKKGIKENLKKD